MRKEILARLSEITEEERALLEGSGGIRRELYTSRTAFVIDSDKLLEKGRLIELRPHTRFARFPRHRHDYVEMIYMCAGSATHIVNGTDRITLAEGDLLFLNQSVYHEILPASAEDIAVNFIILPQFFDRTISMIEEENVLRDFLLSTLARGNAPSGYLHMATKGIPPVENLIENLIWLLLDRKSGVNTICQTTMGLLFLSLSRFVERINQTDPRSREQAAVYDALRYIESNYAAGTLADVAAALGMPEYTLSRLLKRFTGMSFKQLLQRRKLEQAAYLLVNTPLTIESVLSGIGYDNSSYFYRRFREKYGCSPAEYRRANGRVPR